jgi:hypothetical protein
MTHLGAPSAAVVHFQVYEIVIGLDLDQEAVAGGGSMGERIGDQLGDTEPDVLGTGRQSPGGQGRQSEVAGSSD